MYEVPDWVSPEAREMLAGILQVDPRRRFRFQDIKEARFWKASNETLMETEAIVVNEELLDSVARAN